MKTKDQYERYCNQTGEPSLERLGYIGKCRYVDILTSKIRMILKPLPIVNCFSRLMLKHPVDNAIAECENTLNKPGNQISKAEHTLADENLQELQDIKTELESTVVSTKKKPKP